MGRAVRGVYWKGADGPGFCSSSMPSFTLRIPAAVVSAACLQWPGSDILKTYHTNILMIAWSTKPIYEAKQAQGRGYMTSTHHEQPWAYMHSSYHGWVLSCKKCMAECWREDNESNQHSSETCHHRCYSMANGLRIYHLHSPSRSFRRLVNCAFYPGVCILYALLQCVCEGRHSKISLLDVLWIYATLNLIFTGSKIWTVYKILWGLRI